MRIVNELKGKDVWKNGKCALGPGHSMPSFSDSEGRDASALAPCTLQQSNTPSGFDPFSKFVSLDQISYLRVQTFRSYSYREIPSHFSFLLSFCVFSTVYRERWTEPQDSRFRLQVQFQTLNISILQFRGGGLWLCPSFLFLSQDFIY